MSALLTPDQAAAYLQISTKTLGRLRRNGEIRYIATGCGLKKRRAAYSLQDLDAFIEARRCQEVEPCLSTSAPARRSIATISNSKVIAFSAQPAPPRRPRHAP